MFGAAGLLWSGWWESLMGNIKQEDPEIGSSLDASLDKVDESAASAKENVPWRAILRNTPVRALSYVHFCNNWCIPVPKSQPRCHWMSCVDWLTQYFESLADSTISGVSMTSMMIPLTSSMIADAYPLFLQ